jgi:hypothetical protein
LAPVTLAERSEARKATMLATSSGWVKLPVAKPPIPATTCRRAVSASVPVAAAAPCLPWAAGLAGPCAHYFKEANIDYDQGWVGKADSRADRA